MNKKAAFFCLLLILTASIHPKETQPAKNRVPISARSRRGCTPKIFAPGIVSTGLDELNAVFSPDGGEFYFCVRSITGPASIFQMQMKKGAWSEPRLLPFASRFGDIDVSVSPAGDALSSARCALCRAAPGRKRQRFLGVGPQGERVGRPRAA